LASTHGLVHSWPTGAADLPEFVNDEFEQPSRFITRPAPANEHVPTNAAGPVVLRLKAGWRDGATHLGRVASPTRPGCAALVRDSDSLRAICRLACRIGRKPPWK